VSTWTRWFSTGSNWTTTAQSVRLNQVPLTLTLNRLRWSWGFAGVTATSVDLVVGQSLLMLAGIVTTIGDGTEVPPNPNAGRNDVAPPTQRWLWWEARVPTVTAIDEAAGTIAWQNSPPQEQVDTRAQVAVPGGLPAGQGLNVWFSFQATANWDASGEARVWVASSLLYGA